MQPIDFVTQGQSSRSTLVHVFPYCKVNIPTALCLSLLRGDGVLVPFPFRLLVWTPSAFGPEPVCKLRVAQPT